MSPGALYSNALCSTVFHLLQSWTGGAGMTFKDVRLLCYVIWVVWIKQGSKRCLKLLFGIYNIPTYVSICRWYYDILMYRYGITYAFTIQLTVCNCMVQLNCYTAINAGTNCYCELSKHTPLTYVGLDIHTYATYPDVYRHKRRGQSSVKF